MEINFINELTTSTTEYEELISSIFNTIDDNRCFDIIFVSKERIHQINRDYRNVDRVTDVISFALNDNDECNYGAEDELGDIFISWEKVIEQANEYGHSILREFAFLVTHGMLHALGYDHQNEVDESLMFGIQDEILEKLKITR